MIDAGVFDSFDWSTHPVIFGYAVTLAVLMWVIWRLFSFVERILGIGKHQAPPDADELPENEDESSA